jgi:hypothetical protein
MRSSFRRLLVAAVGLGFIGAVGSALAVRELHPTQDGYAGEARLHGAPLPYAYEITVNDAPGEFENELSCQVAWPACRYPAPSASFGVVGFGLDWLVWSTLVGVGTGVAVAASRLQRRPRS